MSNDVLPNEIPFFSANSKVCNDYSFDASAQTVTVSRSDVDRVLYIVNSTRNEVIYNPYDDAKLGTLSGNVLTLDFPTNTAMQDGDQLLILYEAIDNTPSLSAFGDQRMVELSPRVQFAATYGLINTDVLETFTGTGGSADTNNNLYRCQSGTSLGGYGVIRSKDSVEYRPGEGFACRFTAKFTTGIALSIQFGGLFSLTETLAFGYDGADFSIIHEYDGQAEVQEIQVTGAASGSESATITLDGDAATANLTNTTIQGNAFEITRDLKADSTLGAKWRFEQIDDTVICIAQSVGNKTGTMSFSSSTATATVSEAIAGQTKSSGNVAQTSWNKNTVSWLDPTKLNVYEVQYGYLGSIGPLFSVLDPNTGKFVKVHQIPWANSETTPNFGNPSMKIGWTAASLGSTGTNLTVEGASGMGAIEGSTPRLSRSKTTQNTKASIGTTLTSVLTIKNRLTYGDRFNRGDILPVRVSVDNEHNKGVIVALSKNATLASVPNYQFIDEINSIVLQDAAGTTVTGGTEIASFTVGAGLSENQELGSLNQLILPDETLTIAVKTISGTATNTTATITWFEEV
ncbi:MAG: hypothetical protein ACXADH_11465 [Candidatus Kariarchaeaceae archaeon]|jgi:hypothetical protein